jgi:uncharacterized protein
VYRRRHRERDELLDRARRLATALPAELRVRAVVVFGSVARGDFNKWSDVDVLVVADGATGGPIERHEALGAVPGRVQPVVWTSTEFSERERAGDPIAREVRTTGVWLVGSAGALGAGS